MNRIQPTLTKIDKDHTVTPDFLRALMQGLLMALQERGVLTDPQLRAAQAQL